VCFGLSRPSAVLGASIARIQPSQPLLLKALLPQADVTILQVSSSLISLTQVIGNDVNFATSRLIGNDLGKKIDKLSTRVACAGVKFKNPITNL
jgi:hypothetical protein